MTKVVKSCHQFKREKKKSQQDYVEVRNIEINVQDGDKTGLFHSQRREDNWNESHQTNALALLPAIYMEIFQTCELAPIE